jgi:putative ABC transport system substrate-binding protein
MLAILAALLASAGAQPAGKVARIGMLCGVRCEGPSYDALREGLRELGWIEGRNLVVEVRSAEGQRERLPALATELVSLKVDVIVAVAPEPSRAARNATSTIPIVMIGVADPVAVGLAESLARPGGNVTGLSTLVPGGFSTKSLALLKESVPNASRIAVFWNSRNEVHQKILPVELPPAAQALGVRLQMIDIREPADIERGFDAAVRERAQALLVIGDPIFHTPTHRLPDLAARNRIPAIYLVRSLVHAGGLISYGPDFSQMFRRAATYVDRILKGARPADLPIEQPTKFELVINLKTAKALGLTFPPSVLALADQIIE